jgi:peptide deformylase
MSTFLQLLLYPHPSLSTPTKIVDTIDEEIISLIESMKIALKNENAKGIAANMFGINKSIIMIEYPGSEELLTLINPEITYFSPQTQTIKEASICLPGVAAEITRPRKIKVTFKNIKNEIIELEAEDMLATIIQHEMDYLEGKIYIDHLSKLKKDLMITKFKKFIKTHVPHVHSASCNH